jgi:hypothetical protein
MGRPRTTRAIGVPCAALILGLAGCAATPKLTPAQERTWDAFHKCSPYARTVNLLEVREDGSYRYSYVSEGENASFKECMKKEQGEAMKAQVAFKFDPAVGALTPPDAKYLVRHAYLTDAPPLEGKLQGLPPKTTSFRSDQLVTFFLGLNRSGQDVRGTFTWYRPDGTVESQQERTLKNIAGSSDWIWYTQALPAAHARAPGTWAVEASINNQVIGRYEFRVAGP